MTGAVVGVESRRRAATVSAIGPIPGDSLEVDEHKVTRSSVSPALAKTLMEPDGGEDGFDRVNSSKSGERSLDWTADCKRCVITGLHGIKHVIRRISSIPCLPILLSRMDYARRDFSHTMKAIAAVDAMVREFACISPTTRGR